MATKKVEPINVSLNFQTIQIPIIGTSELIVHNWSEKTKRQMLDKMMGKKMERKVGKNPQEDYESTFYYHPDGGYGFPSPGFKAAIVDACRHFDGLAMTLVRVSLRVDGEFVHIYGEPRMREDMVRVGMGVADIRHRAAFPKWKTILPITYNANTLSMEILYNLVNGAGFGGIGEWRPSKSKTGSFGCFRLAQDMQEWEAY